MSRAETQKAKPSEGNSVLVMPPGFLWASALTVRVCLCLGHAVSEGGEYGDPFFFLIFTDYFVQLSARLSPLEKDLP